MKKLFLIAVIVTATLFACNSNPPDEDAPSSTQPGSTNQPAPAPAEDTVVAGSHLLGKGGGWVDAATQAADYAITMKQ